MAKSKDKLKAVLGTTVGSALDSKKGTFINDLTGIKGLTSVSPVTQYGPTDYIADTQTTPQVVTATTTATSSADIYMDHMEASNKAIDLDDIADVLNESCNKLDSLLSDANNYWKSSAATLFTSKVEEYITEMKKYRDYLETKSDALKNSSNSYKDFDSAFAQLRIE